MIEVSRRPVLILWGTIVAERLGFERDEALTLGRALATLGGHLINEPAEVVTPAKIAEIAGFSSAMKILLLKSAAFPSRKTVAAKRKQAVKSPSRPGPTCGLHKKVKRQPSVTAGCRLRDFRLIPHGSERRL